MKEYEYTIIRRVSRNPKRNREARGVSQSDLEALRQELAGDQNATVTAVRDDLELVDIASEGMRNRLETAEQALTGKLDSGAFAQWQAGDYANRQSSLDEELRKKLGSDAFQQWRAGELAKALAGKQPAGSYASLSQLNTSARDAIAEAIKRAGEMDKQIKVGGRNLIVTSRWKAGYLYGDRDENAYPVGSENYKVLVGYDTFRFDPVYIPTLGEREVTYKLYDNGGSTSGTVQIHAYDKDKKFLWWSFDGWDGTIGHTNAWTLPTDTAYIRLGVTNENVRAKVEFGTVVTDWAPAPEDLDDSISKVNTSLTSLASTLLDPEQGEIHKLTSQLTTSAQQTLAEAIKRAGEMDKAIKVGGRNLFRNKYFIGDLASRYEIPFDALQPREGDNTYTLSLDYKISLEDKASLIRISCWYIKREFGGIVYDSDIKRDGEWHHKEYTFKLDIDPSKYPIYGWFTDYSSSNGRTIEMVAVRNVKLERGTVATDWTPAPEDVAESVSNVNSSLTKLERSLLDPNQGEINKLKTLLGKHSESFEELATHPLTVDENGFWRIWSVKDSQYVTTQYKSRGDKGDKGEDGAKGDKGDTPNLSLDEQYRLVADGKLVSQQSLKGRDGEDAGRYLGRAKRIRSARHGNYMLETETGWRTAKEGDYVYLVGDLSNRGGDKDTYYIVREHTSKTEWEVYNIKGHTPRLTLDEQFHLLADGEMVSMQSLKGRDGEDGKDGERGADGKDGHTPHIDWNGTKLVIDNMAPVDLRGEAGHSPSAEDVLQTEDFKEMLGHRVKQQVAPVSEVLKKTKSSFEKSLKEVDAWQTNFSLSVINDFKTANDNIASLKTVALTLQQKEDLGYLTTALRLKMAGGEGDKKTLEGLALQRYIALSGNGKDVTAYLASDALDAVLKAGVTGFGTRTEQEQVAIYHNGTGHLGNLHFAGNHIDFKTGRDDAPYLSIGAEESQFIDDFIDTARLVDTPVSVGTVTLSESSMVYERWVTVDNDGTRLTVSIDELEVETYRGARTRLTLDGKVLGEWRGVERYSHGGGGGIYIDPQYDEYPYKASNLSYERVVKAGSYRLRLEIEDATSGATATVKGLRVRRLYDTGRQQSSLTKSGLRLFGSPDRYLDVDYRREYYQHSSGSGAYATMEGWVTNPYIVRIKGGAKVDKLTADEVDAPGVPLCGASFDASGSQVKAFGKYANKQGSNRAQAVYYDSGRFFRVYHSIGHTNYLPTVQVIGDNGNDINWSLAARIYAVNANDFAVRIITNGDNPIRHAFSFVAFKTM